MVRDFKYIDVGGDVIVETMSDLLNGVFVINATYLPLQYPLLFSKGEDGYRDDILLNDSCKASSKKR